MKKVVNILFYLHIGTLEEVNKEEDRYLNDCDSAYSVSESPKVSSFDNTVLCYVNMLIVLLVYLHVILLQSYAMHACI